MADIVRSVMKETGISVIDLIAAAAEIARLEYPSELVSRRDEIIGSLYVGFRCVECTNMGRKHVASTAVHVIEEAQNSPIDQGKANFSGPPEVVAEDNIQRLENAKRKLRDSSEMAATAKKQRNVELLWTNEVPKQGTGMLSRKGVVRTQISSTSNAGRGKVLPKRRVSKLQMLRRAIKSHS